MIIPRQHQNIATTQHMSGHELSPSYTTDVLGASMQQQVHSQMLQGLHISGECLQSARKRQLVMWKCSACGQQIEQTSN